MFCRKGDPGALLDITQVNAAVQIVPLDLLNAGENARIVQIDGDPTLVTRLHEMGLHDGVGIRMVQPGQPCIIAVGHHRLSFRGDEAAVILVEIE
jgi:ferrous iron transport protein A